MRIFNNAMVSVFFSNLISKVQQLIRIDRVSQYHVQSHSPNKSSLQFSDLCSGRVCAVMNGEEGLLMTLVSKRKSYMVC